MQDELSAHIESIEGIAEGQGVRLHFHDWGGPALAADAVAPTPLLLLHGLASAAHIWDLVAPILARDRRVVALDQRGHGLSEKPDTGYDFATICADAIAVADALGLGERFAVAGHSWGANVALELAAAYPDRIAALTLVDGGFAMLRGRPGATWETISRDLAPPDYAGTPRETFLQWIHASIPGAPPEVDEIELHIVELHADDTVGPRLALANHMQILRALWDEDAEAAYRAVRAPVLYILAEPSDAANQSGTALKRANVAHAQQLLVGTPHVAIEWLADTVHDIPLQRPALLADHIATFLSAL